MPAIIWTFIGSACGTLAVQHLDSEFLAQVVPVLLIAFALYFAFSHKVGDEDRHQRLSRHAFALLIGFSLGFYDGFFGPGTGSFFAAAFVLLMGFNLRRATAGTKILNFTSNIASLLFFAVAGHVLWLLGLCMGVAQIGGAWVGSHLVIKHGSQVIRPLLVTVSILMSLKLLLTE